ncbi:MAG: Nif3-like dinuclear metal center hexameric protein [Candidatus Hydrogenedentes bacterium]|nr:Nif3-like dinuclear metal center hexameric protein [Candidatus Hydrogenedentota bacterium]
MQVRDVIAAVDSWAPPALAYDWDKVGLSTGRPDAKVSKILVALTVTSDVLKAAVAWKAQMIVSHHPLIWEPLTTLRSDNAQARLCLNIANKKIACYSAHTNLDVVPQGVNHILAERLGLTEVAPLFPVPHAQQLKLVTFVPQSHLAAVRDAVSAAGAGVIGDYTHCSFSAPGTGTFKPGAGASPYSGSKHRVNQEPELRFETLLPKARAAEVIQALKEAHPYEEVAYDLVQLDTVDPTMSLGLRGELTREIALDTFAARVRKALAIKHVRVVGNGKDKVRNVAVLGGAGGRSAADVPDDVDVFVTGDVKYHEALDARERGLNIIDAGHHGTEKWIVPALAEYLKKNLKGARVTAYNEPDPFRVVTK